MDLKKLFSVQKVLRDRINYQGSDRFDKLVLALLVEVGECANEWRGFKFWSKDQEPRTKTECEECGGDKVKGLYDDVDCFCEDVKNPLLEEYVDGLHFILELGIEIDFQPVLMPGLYPINKTIMFIEIYYKTSELKFLLSEFGKQDKTVRDSYQDLFDYYLHLGKQLGFTLEEIEAAYYEKNKINHDRQTNGY